MIFDFHAHIYPEKIAKSVLNSLEKEAGFKSYGSGTASGLRDEMKTSGVSACAVLAVSVSPELVEPTNRWIIKQTGDGFFPVGSIHPFYREYAAEIRRLRDAGVRGIKFHPIFQNFRPDDEKVFPIYEEIIRNRMFMIFHAGSGLSTKPEGEVMATPERIARLLELFPGIKLVVAHFGGFGMIEDAKRELIGKDVYIDTSYPPGLHFQPVEWVLEILNKHSPERILFGTDTPFSRQSDEVQYIVNLPIPDDLKEKILWKNAVELLGISA